MTRANRSTTLVAFGCALAMMSVPTPGAQASGRPPIHLEQYGQATVRDLPRATPDRGTQRAMPFHPTKPDAFGRGKSRQTIEAPIVAAVTGTATVALSDESFDGVRFAEAGTLPPDTQIAVGPDHIVEAVNGLVRVWSRLASPPSVVNSVDLGSFFGVGFLTTLTDIVSDPRVIYDASSGRWFVSCVTLETLLDKGDWRLAVSKTSDPLGAYTLYAASFTGKFPDFPSLGVSDDKVVLTGNAFTISTEQFLGSEFLVENKTDLVSGVSAPTGAFFGPPQAVDTIQAARSLSSTSTLFLAAVPSDGQSTALQIWSIDGVPGVGAGVIVSTRTLTQQTPLLIPPDAVQPSSTVGIATNDARLLNLMYRDGFLWMGSTTGCTPAGDTSVRACLHFAQVDTAAQSLVQEITFGEPGASYYYPAVAIDANGNMVTVFNRSSSSEFASIYVSGHTAGDPAGALARPLLIRSGLAVFDPSPNPPRWGDYSGIAVDPFDFDASIWIAAEYMGGGGGLNWGTWIARVSAGGGCALPPAPTGLVASAGDAHVTLNWAAIIGAAGYTIKRGLAAGGPFTPIASIATLAYDDAGLVNGTTYYYVVSATNACGEGANSAVVSGRPIAVQPIAPPTKLNSVASKGKVKLGWTQSTTPGVTQNRIYRSTGGGPYAVIASIGATTTYTDTKVTGGTTYSYVVTAVNANGESAPSNAELAKPK